jgi:hypothetical protein
MKNLILLTGAMMIAAPALAQVTPNGTEPVQAVPSATPAPATTAPSAPESTPTAAVATDGAQVAQAVETQFGSYDANGDGKLSRTEFAAWMVALKTASDPATKAESAATQKWVGAAFAQADTDKNRSLDKGEVTGFLSQGRS